MQPTKCVPRTYTCHLCEESCANRTSYYRHIKSHTRNQVASTYERKCHDYFRSITVLQRGNSIFFQCNICLKIFKSRQNNAFHAFCGKNSNSKPFKCVFCDKSFVLKGSYNDHIKTHTKEKPYTCTVCNKEFITSVTLAAHEKTHFRKRTIFNQQQNQTGDTTTTESENYSECEKELMHQKLYSPTGSWRKGTFLSASFA